MISAQKGHKKIQPILILVIFITLGILTVVFFSAVRTRSTPPRVDTIPATDQEATLSIAGVSMVTTRDGKTAWNLSAKTGNYLDQHKKAVFGAISAVFFTSEGRQVFLSADEGTYNSASNDLEVSGHVVIKNDQYQMETALLMYDHSHQLFSSEASVSVKSDSAGITADSMAYDLRTEKITLNGNVSGTIIDNIVL